MKALVLISLVVLAAACGLDSQQDSKSKTTSSPNSEVAGQEVTKSDIQQVSDVASPVPYIESQSLPQLTKILVASKPEAVSLHDRIVNLEFSSADSTGRFLEAVKNAPKEPLLFVTLVRTNQLHLVKALVASGQTEGMLAADGHGRVLLHYAQSVEMVNYLWDFKLLARYNPIPFHAVRDELGRTPLQLFVQENFVAGIQVYLEKLCASNWFTNKFNAYSGPILNNQDVDGRTALHSAVRLNNRDEAKALMTCVSVKLDTADILTGRTPLHSAASNSDFTIGLDLLSAAKARSINLDLVQMDKASESIVETATKSNNAQAFGLIGGLLLNKIR